MGLTTNQYVPTTPYFLPHLPPAAGTCLACKRRVAQSRRINRIHPPFGRVGRGSGRGGRDDGAQEQTTNLPAAALPARSSRPSQREGEAGDCAGTLNTYAAADGEESKNIELCCVGLVTKRDFHRDKPGWRAGLAVIKSTAPHTRIPSQLPVSRAAGQTTWAARAVSSAFSGSFSRISSKIWSASMFSACASKFKITRWRMAGMYTRRMSSKLTL